MKDTNPDDTQPLPRKRAGDTRPQPASGTKPTAKAPATRTIAGYPIRIILLIFFSLGLLTLLSGLLGWSQGRLKHERSVRAQLGGYLYEQYSLAQTDYDEGRYELARQRYEYIFVQDGAFLDVADRWLDVMVILDGTATPAPNTPTVLPTSTIDPRPAEELFTLAQSMIEVGDWNLAIEMLSSLRAENSAYNFVEVDRMLYLALRNRGFIQILVEGNLEGGLYDFSLAEGFGPIDAAAENLRNLARLYLIGNSFWFAYPDVAAFYYGQVSSAAPNLRDSEGISAFYRYWASLVQYADQLALQEEWCAASEQYKVALAASNRPNVVPTAQHVNELCLLLTPSATFTVTITGSATIAPIVTFTPTPTNIPNATATSTSLPPPTETSAPPTAAFTATYTSTSPPAATATPTPIPTTPLPTATPTATPTVP